MSIFVNDQPELAVFPSLCARIRAVEKAVKYYVIKEISLDPDRKDKVTVLTEDHCLGFLIPYESGEIDMEKLHRRATATGIALVRTVFEERLSKLS